MRTNSKTQVKILALKNPDTNLKLVFSDCKLTQ